MEHYESIPLPRQHLEERVAGLLERIVRAPVRAMGTDPNMPLELLGISFVRQAYRVGRRREPRRQEFDDQTDGRGGEESVGPYDLRPATRCAVPLSGEVVFADHCHALEAEMTGQREGGLTENRKAACNLSNVHTQVDVRSQETPGGALQLKSSAEGIEAPNDDVGIAKRERLVLPFCLDRPNAGVRANALDEPQCRFHLRAAEPDVFHGRTDLPIQVHSG